MTKTLCLLMALTMLSQPAAAQIKVTVPAEVSLKPGRLGKIAAATDKPARVQWFSASEDLDVIPSETGAYVIVSSPTAGRYIVVAYSGDATGPSAPAVCVVAVAGPLPPTPPVPPGPGPIPPVPPSPIPIAGLRVLVVYDPARLSGLPKGQADILTSADLRSYLNQKCVPGPDGKTREWRVLSKTADVSKESPLWQGATRLPMTSYPWLIVSDGKQGFSGPLPASLQDTMAVLKKFGG